MAHRASRWLLPLALLAGAALMMTSCSALSSGPEQVELISEPPGATVRLRGGGRIRTLRGVTPMTIGLTQNLPDPIEIEFLLEGHRPVRRRIFKQRHEGVPAIKEDGWYWPSEPIRARLTPNFAGNR